MLLSACSTTERVVVKAEIVRVKIPGALLTPCDAKQRGKLETTQDIVDRLLATEGALDRCRARVNSIKAWNSRQ
jgi:hypothetical protein